MARLRWRRSCGWIFGRRIKRAISRRRRRRKLSFPRGRLFIHRRRRWIKPLGLAVGIKPRVDRVRFSRLGKAQIGEASVTPTVSLLFQGAGDLKAHGGDEPHDELRITTKQQIDGLFEALNQLGVGWG